MSVLLNSDLSIRIDDNKDALEKFKNNKMKGYFTFKDSNNNIITKEINIKEIKDVYNCSLGSIINTYVSFSFYKPILVRKYLIFKEKNIKLINVPNGYYSQDFYSSYDPYGMLYLDFVKLDKEDSFNFYVNNSKQCDQFSNLFN